MREANSIHGLWIGRQLSRLEHLTLRSFLRQGHPFNLWVYDELEDELPEGVVLHDASRILPRDRIFLKEEPDPGSIIGKKSYGPFSDLFRYKLLHDEGGIWVDMDLTCLKPFDFDTPYLFRAHKIGVMGNLLKAPKGSELMRRTFEMADDVACESVPWLALNRILTRNVHDLELNGYVRNGIINDDADAANVIQAFAASEFRQPPQDWYAIHWANEYWGKRAAHELEMPFPTKDEPARGSFLHEMYRAHGLIDARGDVNGTRALPNVRAREMRSRPARQKDRQTVNMLLPTLNRGGAERIVIDVATSLCADPAISVYLYVRRTSQRAHRLPQRDNLHICFLDEPGAPTLVEVGQELVERGNPVLFTHLVPADQLQQLWNAGVLTVPVVHNARQGWGDDPARYANPNVPFAIACCDTVRAELEALSCPVPAITVRHEVTWRPRPKDLAKARQDIRDRWGIGPETLLIGMIGQFKSQKAYPRAIRILAEVQKLMPAKLMIVGGWDHQYGAGRTTFEATMRLAVELGVVADVILAGETDAPADYLAAFDLFLNTSVFEGLSVSMMEAQACGCPMVVSDVGGTRELADERTFLIEDGADVDAYVGAIVQAAHRDARPIPPPPSEIDLVPQIWLGLSNVAPKAGASGRPAPNGTLFVIDGLHPGGPAVSLGRTLAATRREHRTAVVSLHGVSVDSIAENIAASRTELFLAPSGVSTARAAQFVLDLVLERNFGTLCFWSAPARLKLLLAKFLDPIGIRIVEVSPGPMLFEELEASRGFQARIAYTAEQYFAGLDRFISLYKGGIPETFGQSCAKTSVVSLGVPNPPSFVPLPPAEILPPESFDPAFAIGTVTRLVPYKKVELLLEAVAMLSLEVPAASLTIVGGADATSVDYERELREKALSMGLANVHFTGPYHDVNRFLAMWRVFVLSGERQGCPNASLEAMAMGLPVVAFDSGGLREQVVAGKTGYIVKTPGEMAARLKKLLTDRGRLAQMSQQARKRARSRFALRDRAQEFAQLLEI